MLEMAINNVEMGSELDRVHILTCCVHFTVLYRGLKDFLKCEFLIILLRKQISIPNAINYFIELNSSH